MQAEDVTGLDFRPSNRMKNALATAAVFFLSIFYGKFV
jgi:hypothetical protein